MYKFLLFSLIALKSFANDTLNYKCNLMIGGNYTSGNYNNYNISSKLNFYSNYRNNYLDININHKYTEIGSIINNDVKYTLKENEKYSNISYTYNQNFYKLICFNEIEQSYLRKTNLRINLGIGLGVKLIQNNNLHLEISEVLLPEHVDYYTNNIFSLRYSTRLKFIYKKNLFDFSEILLFQPNIFNSENVQYTDNLNIRNSLNLDFVVFKNISIGISDEYIYQSYIHFLYNKQKFDNLTTFYVKINIL